MKTIKLLLMTIIVVFLMPTSPMSAQDLQNISIIGAIKEAGTHTPIAYATILLTDSSGNVAGTVSADNGGFEIKTTGGRKKVSISYIGYIKHTIDLDATTSIDLGDILLQPDAKTLSEVVVKASKPIIKREVDKLVIDAKSLSAVSSNAIDLLKRSPGLLVSEEGTISVIGKGKLIVLINGREWHMTEQELTAHLRSMPSQEIERIEIMTTPPAKYRAEGDAGIINIVERRKLPDYFGGTLINQFYASKGQANDLSGTLKYQKKNLFLYLNSSCGIGALKKEQTLEKRYSDKYWQEQSGTRNANRYASSDLGFELNLPKNFKTGGRYAFISFSPDREIEENVTITEQLQNTPRHLTGANNIDRKMLRHNGSLFLAKNWGRKTALVS